MTLCDVKRKMSTSHNPQKDGLYEVMNRMLENYIRCYCALNQTNWDDLLPTAEFAYNSAISEGFGTSPFEVDLGWNPKSTLYLLKTNKVSFIESLAELQKRMYEDLEDARIAHHLVKARQSAYSARKGQPHPYTRCDMVWLDKVLFWDVIARNQQSAKLGAKSFGPFNIVDLIGRNAIRLELPQSARIHAVVHVEHTRPYRVQPARICALEEKRLETVIWDDNEVQYLVDDILGHRKRGRGFQLLTDMKSDTREEAAWKPVSDFVDDDSTTTYVFLEYIDRHVILRHIH